MTTKITRRPLASGLILLDHVSGTSGELELDWGSAPWRSEASAAQRRPRRKRGSFAAVAKRLSSRFSPAWAGAMALAGVQLCPACRSRNHHQATFCHECHVTLREVKLSRRREATPARRRHRTLEIQTKVVQALVGSLVVAVLWTALVL